MQRRENKAEISLRKWSALVSILGNQFFIQNPKCWVEEEEGKGVPCVFISPLSLGSGWSRGDSGVGLGGGSPAAEGEPWLPRREGRHTGLLGFAPGC